jgi:hypothetical protein
MNEQSEGRQRKRKRFWLLLMALAAILLAGLIVPPLVSVSRYKAQITQLISTSLGRPVHLSSVEVRLLPRPGFVLTDLTVEDDPGYGAEPVLHANTVAASIRLLSLWRGRLEIDTISVDEASLNLVRTSAGSWNLDPLLRTATAHAQTAPASAGLVKLPYLEATNSRINIKNGVEKLPFSIVNARISLWQPDPGEWRVRLRGEPVRTDISLEQADTGIVRLEADMHQAPELRQMPVHVDLEWSQAQLGQLTRLLLGSDAGWRGDLTGDLQLDGTAEAAQIKARLRATGVHRAEFAPAAPMDFDANCGFAAHITRRAIDNLACDSPLGDGHIRLTGDLPGDGGLPRLSVELDRISVAVGLDALRTVRSNLAPGLDASGSASGKITYAPGAASQAAPNNAAQEKLVRVSRNRFPKAHAAAEGPLTGSIAIEGFQLSGSGLSEPIRIPKLFLEPAPAAGSQLPGIVQPPALAATVAVPAGAPVPLTISTRLALSGYQVVMRGQASMARAKELAAVAGFANTAGLNEIAGGPISVDLTAEGPWVPAEKLSFGGPSPATQAGPPLPQPAAAPPGDSLTGTMTLRDVNWKADYLANHVEISQATLNFAGGEIRWNPVVFSYGPVKGTASLTLPAACDPPQTCTPTFQAQFGALDSVELQAAFLGAHERGTLLSTLIDRFHRSDAPAWPQLEGTIKAESLVLGPVTLHNAAVTLRTLANGAEITVFEAGLLGGCIQGTGTLHTASSAQDKPFYALEGQFEKLSPQAIGQLLRLRLSGGTFAGNGKIDLTGFTAMDLASSAQGALHFQWRHGAVVAASGSGQIPPALARFESWTADAGIGSGLLTLKQSEVKRGSHTTPVLATVTITEPPKVVFAGSKRTPVRR